jgi:hypothetical protein
MKKRKHRRTPQLVDKHDDPNARAQKLQTLKARVDWRVDQIRRLLDIPLRDATIEQLEEAIKLFEASRSLLCSFVHHLSEKLTYPGPGLGLSTRAARVPEGGGYVIPPQGQTRQAGSRKGHT